MQTTTRIMAPEGTYRVWVEDDKPRCVEELPDGSEREVTYWHDIPRQLHAKVDEALRRMLPVRFVPDPEGPWSNQRFRFQNLDRCSDCGGSFA